MATKRKKKGAAPASAGITATEVAEGRPPREVEALGQRIVEDGGAVLSTYRDPFGGGWLILASLPIEKVEPTPYQRDLSETHADRLTGVIQKVGQFLDPVVVVPQPGAYWTPNGMHRHAAMTRLGAKAITALVVPDEKVALRILALNTEKAHNLKDKALEVIRIARALSEAPHTAEHPEAEWAFEFEEPAYLTVGLCYEKRPRFAGGAYLPVLRRTDAFLTDPISDAISVREGRAEKVLEIDDEVQRIVGELRERGLKSAYLKPFVVARLNPLRFVKAEKPGQKAPKADADATLDKMLASARKFDSGKVRPQDLAAMAGAPVMDD
jgi:ParB family transcriptional regulator, chromosome partitioning protein